jgi:autotransporter-associated beta strand protein
MLSVIRRTTGVRLRSWMLLAAALVVMAVPPASATTCSYNNYELSFFTPPPIANWTDSAIWLPSTGFPGCVAGESAGDSSASGLGSPTTYIINSLIPYSLGALDFRTIGGEIDIQSGGHLGLAGPGTLRSGFSLEIWGGDGVMEVASGGILTFLPGAGFGFRSTGGSLWIDTGGEVDGIAETGSPGDILVDGIMTLSGDFDASSIAGSGVISLGSSTLTAGGGNSDATFAGTFSGTGGLTKTGSGTLYLLGDSTASGPLTIDEGTVVLSGTWGGTIVLNGGSLVSVPEPGTGSLLAISAFVIGAIAARRRRKTRVSP